MKQIIFIWVVTALCAASMFIFPDTVSSYSAGFAAGLAVASTIHWMFEKQKENYHA